MRTQHMMQLVYRILPASAWREAEILGRYAGSAVDERDGYIHLSNRAQLEETARRHFSGLKDLVLVAILPETLGDALRFEPSRNGELFPHLYGPLPVSAAAWVKPLPWDGTRHVFPDLAS